MGILKKYCLKFKSIQDNFLFIIFFVCNIYKMVDSIGIYKSKNINMGTTMKNTEMLKFVSDHLKTKKMCEHEVKKLPYLIRNVPD